MRNQTMLDVAREELRRFQPTAKRGWSLQLVGGVLLTLMALWPLPASPVPMQTVVTAGAGLLAVVASRIGCAVMADRQNLFGVYVCDTVYGAGHFLVALAFLMRSFHSSDIVFYLNLALLLLQIVLPLSIRQVILCRRIVRNDLYYQEAVLRDLRAGCKKTLYQPWIGVLVPAVTVMVCTILNVYGVQSVWVDCAWLVVGMAMAVGAFSRIFTAVPCVLCSRGMETATGARDR